MVSGFGVVAWQCWEGSAGIAELGPALDQGVCSIRDLLISGSRDMLCRLVTPLAYEFVVHILGCSKK
jgi:hypothetical protein